jgi:hypothetical protein
MALASSLAEDVAHEAIGMKLPRVILVEQIIDLTQQRAESFDGLLVKLGYHARSFLII